jgi:hypothetical protein
MYRTRRPCDARANLVNETSGCPDVSINGYIILYDSRIRWAGDQSTSAAMPRAVPQIHIPHSDLWTVLFERKDKPFPDSQGIHLPSSFKRNWERNLILPKSSTNVPLPAATTHTRPSATQQSNLDPLSENNGHGRKATWLRSSHTTVLIHRQWRGDAIGRVE